MSEFVIEKNVPIPENAGHKGNHSPYPFAGMEIGDSFFVPCEKGRDHRVSAAAANYARRKHAGKKFSTRRTSTGVRCWRIQ